MVLPQSLAIAFTAAALLRISATPSYAAPAPDPEPYHALILAAGNAEDDSVRLGHLRKLADQVQRDGAQMPGLDSLIAVADRWTSPAERLAFFSREVTDTLDYDLGIPSDSPLAPLGAFYRARMLVWVTLESSAIYPHPQIRSLYLSKARTLLEEAGKRFKKNRIISMYRGEPIEPERAYAGPVQPPRWAALQRNALERLTDVIDWWIDNRLQPNGEYGGGWGDDCEMWRHWAPILIGFNYPKANWAQAYHSERLLSQDHLKGGYHNRMTDVEHSAEDVSDALTPMMHIAPDNPGWAERALRLIELAETLWMGRNDRGFLQFRSTYFTATDVDLSPARACDTVYHPRALQPALLYWQRTGDDRVGRLVTEWMRTWIDAAAREERGKPAGILPTALHWPDGGIGGIGENWWVPENYPTPLYDFPSAMGQLLNTLLLAFHQTGDEAFLEPIKSMAAARSEWSRSTIADAPPGSRMWCAAQLDQLAGVLAKYRLLTGDSRSDEILAQEKEAAPYAQYLLAGDKLTLTSALAQLARVLDVNFPAYTSEVRYTDRVFRFPILYQPGWITEEGSPDSLIVIEAGVMSMGLNRIHLLYNTVTGDPGSPLYFPLNAVRWHTSPRNIAALVMKSSSERFEAKLYHFGSEERNLDCEFFLLASGEYNYSLTDTTTGASAESGRITIRDGNRRVPLTLPPNTELILRVQPL